MIKNYFKIALRNLVKNKGYSFTNIFGLAVGMASCFVIFLYVQLESSYDSYHEKADRTYRITVEEVMPGERKVSSETPFPLAPVFKEENPEVESIGRVFFSKDNLVTSEGKEFYEDVFSFADPEIFAIFDFEVLKGDRERFLKDPSSIVITESTAEKYFGSEEPLGKIIEVNNDLKYTVSGVIADIPVNSHFHVAFLAPMETLNEDIVGFDIDQWGLYTSLYTYIVLRDGASIDALAEKTKDFISERENEREDRKRTAIYQSLTDIHLSEGNESEIEEGNSVSNLMILGTIGFFILLIACINFMNLTTARSSRRMKEIGVRKVLGAYRTQLIRQFVSESVLLTMIAFMLAVMLVELCLPYFSGLVGKEVTYGAGGKFIIWGVFFLVALATGILSSLYPALFLSGFKPVKILSGLKGGGSGQAGALVLRKVLVVAQFAISIILITGTLVVKEQLNYLDNKELGFNKDLTLIIEVYDDTVLTQGEAIKNELSLNPNVISTSAALKPPIGANNFNTTIFKRGETGDEAFVSLEVNPIDYDYLDQFGLKLLAGRNFSPDFKSDEMSALIINESLSKELGYSRPEEALNNIHRLGINKMEGRIVGVVKDFHNVSLHNEIKPMAFLYWPDFFYTYSVKIRSGDVQGTIAYIKDTWERFSPGFPFKYSFLDDDVRQQYESERKVSETIGTFSLIAISIACLGLFGLAAFTADRRVKEIGIRKTLGASVSGIVLLISKDFLKLVIIANLIAIPVAYYFMNKWLEEFAFHIDISVFTFLLAGFAAFLIAVITVSYQSIKAALANPVKSLKYE